MSEARQPTVDAEPPDSPINLTGTDHITVEGTNTAETIEFYRDLLGMPLVLCQPNLDRAHLTHLFFDTGDGRLLSFFVNEDRDSADIPEPDPGQVHHLAFRIDGDRIADIADALDAAGYPVTEFDRGAFHSLYTEDNNGLGIELVADKFPVPDTRRSEVLALAQQLRIDAGADYVKSEHMREAIQTLGLDVTEKPVRDAAAGRDF